MTLSETSPTAGSFAADSSDAVAVHDLSQLQASLEAHGLEIPETAAVRFSQYGRRLWEWNSRLNLTRHTDWEMFVTRDLLDTLELSPHVPSGAAVLDIGSGGGVPGIPLAILRSDLRLTLCDSVTKKALALQDIVTSLGLPVQVAADRAEQVLKTQRFDVTTARAVASITRLLGWLTPVWKAAGQLLLIKGPRWIEEQSEAEAEGLLKRFQIEQIAAWKTPGRDGQSVLLRVTRKAKG